MRSQRDSNARDRSPIRAAICLALLGFLSGTAVAQDEIGDDFDDLSDPLGSWVTHGPVSVVQDLRSALNFPDWFGDGNGDGDVTIADLAGLQDCFNGFDTAGTNCSAYDLDSDSEISIHEYEAFLLRIADTHTFNRVMLLEESNNGSVCRAYLPLGDLYETDEMLSFRYRFVHYGDPAGTTVLPDSFEVFLTEDFNRLILGPMDMPYFTWWTFSSLMFFYQDSDPNKPFNPDLPDAEDDALVFTSQYVTVSDPPDELGYRTVVLDLTSLPSAPHTSILEFGLNSTNNGVRSYVAIDDVKIGCPTGFCCGTSGAPLPPKEGQPCEIFDCVVDGQGVPSWVSQGEPRDCCTGCLVGPTQAYDVLFLVDVSGTTGPSDLDASLAAITQILNDWDAAAATNSQVILPRVAVGTFAQGAQIVLPETAGFTTDYDELRTGLVSSSGDFPLGGLTSMSEGLRIGGDHFEAHADPGRNKVLVVVSDGWTNFWDPGQYSASDPDYDAMLEVVDCALVCPDNPASPCAPCYDPVLTVIGATPTDEAPLMPPSDNGVQPIFDRLETLWNVGEFKRINDGFDQAWTDSGEDGITYQILASYIGEATHHLGHMPAVVDETNPPMPSVSDVTWLTSVSSSLGFNPQTSASTGSVGERFYFSRTLDSDPESTTPVMSSLQAHNTGDKDHMITFQMDGGQYDGDYIIVFDTLGDASDYNDFVIRISGAHPVTCDTWCDCPAAKLAALIESDKLRNNEIELFAINYPSSVAGTLCSESPDLALFLGAGIAHTLLHYMATTPGSEDLNCLFERLRSRIACGDGDLCTVDACNQDGECIHMAIDNCPDTDIEPPTGPTSGLNFGYEGITANYDGSMTLTLTGSTTHSSGDVFVTTTPSNRASFSLGTLGGGNADLTAGITVSDITATTANGVGTLTLTDVDGSTITADVDGSFLVAGTPQDPTIFFQGTLLNTVYAFADNTFDGASSNISISDFDTNLTQGNTTQFEFDGNWFTAGVFSTDTLQLDGSIRLPSGS